MSGDGQSISKRPTWVLQADAFSVPEFEALSRAARALGCPVETVRIVPFSHEPVGSIPRIGGPSIVYGAAGMMNLARAQGWRPGGWDGPTFSMQRVIEALGPLVLNANAVVTPYSKAADTADALGWDQVFVRPDAEGKEFAGSLYTPNALRAHIERMRAVDYFAPADNPVILAPAKRLGREWRAFVVDGDVVDISLYAVGGDPQQSRGAPVAAIAMATTAAEACAPAPVFVMDIAEVLEGQREALRVVEVNAFNSSGFYACDIETIVSAVTAFVEARARSGERPSPSLP